MRNMGWRWIFIAPAAVLGILLFIAVGGEVVKYLWNWLLPPMFGWREITFWQAVGLLALSRILFGGHGFSRSGVRRRMSDRMAERMAQRMGQRWDQMTPEEQERFRQGIRARCGFGPSTSESKGQ
jgi:hypothetical protein